VSPGRAKHLQDKGGELMREEASVSGSEPTRPLPPARVLPPPSVPPGYPGARGEGRRPPHQQPYPSPQQQPYPTYQGQQPQPPYPSALSAGPPPQHGYAPQGYPQQWQRQGYGQAGPYPPHGFQQYRPQYPPQERFGAYQHPQWGYGWPPPPPRRHRGAKVALALVGISAVVVFVLILANAITGTVASTTESVAVDHSPARASNPNANPVDTSDARAVLDGNTLYEQGGLTNGDCPARDLGDAGTVAQTAFYKALMSCLNEEWRPAVESAGYDYTEPGLVVFDAEINTPCGDASPQDGRMLAFYCPNDEVMYADVSQMRKYFGDNDVAYAIVIGHEFGHHVQNEVGSLDAFETVSYDDFDNRLDLNRRVELQASCLGGLFLGAIAKSYPMDETKLQQLNRVAGSFGDEPGGDDGDRDHGSGASNREWINTGYSQNDLAGCNTFTAPGDQVD